MKIVEKIINLFFGVGGFAGLAAGICMLMLPSVSSADMMHASKPDSAKKCAICHYQWIYSFYIEHRDGELVQQPEGKEVADEEMCFSCHDGSVADSRASAFHGSGHRAGAVPSKRITIPEEFPLDEEGRLQCATCHTPHALSSEFEEDFKGEVFLRAENKDSSFCKLCHSDKTGGPENGNHPVDISAQQKPYAILNSKGKFGREKKNHIVCETCHVAHGGVKGKFLVLSVDNGDAPLLCITCHGTNPAAQKSGGNGSAPGSHPVNVPSDHTTFPRQWSNDEAVAVGMKGEIVCITCHSPHKAVSKKNLLVERNYKDSLCLKCHLENSQIAGSLHDVRKFAPDEKNIQGDSASTLGPCSSCHLVHSGSGRVMWARKKPIENETGEYCFSCHSSSGLAKKVLPKDFSHPMDVSFQSGEFYRSKMKIGCATCHDLHTASLTYDDPVQKGEKHSMFLRMSDKGASGICITCHPRHGLVEGTDHDLRITAPNTLNSSGKIPEQVGLCSPCHLAHNAQTQRFLWAGPLGPNVLPEWNQAYAVENQNMIKLCTGCHIAGGPGQQHVPKFGLHPKDDGQVVTSSAYYDLVQFEYPFYTTSGDVSTNGDIVCSTCHNPHQWDPHRKKKGAGADIEGNATNSFLRLNLPSELCAYCHAKDGLIKFKYFHSKFSRAMK